MLVGPIGVRGSGDHDRQNGVARPPRSRFELSPHPGGSTPFPSCSPGVEHEDLRTREQFVLLHKGLEAVTGEQCAQSRHAARCVVHLDDDLLHERPVARLDALQHVLLRAFRVDLQQIDPVDAAVADPVRHTTYRHRVAFGGLDALLNRGEEGVGDVTSQAGSDGRVGGQSPTRVSPDDSAVGVEVGVQARLE